MKITSLRFPFLAAYGEEFTCFYEIWPPDPESGIRQQRCVIDKIISNRDEDIFTELTEEQMFNIGDYILEGLENAD